MEPVLNLMLAEHLAKPTAEAAEFLRADRLAIPPDQTPQEAALRRAFQLVASDIATIRQLSASEQPADIVTLFGNRFDEKIAALNTGVKLPNLPITVVYRSDGSGTTSIFTDYLAKVSASWKSTVGSGKSVKFPVGVGAKGNPGVSGLVKQTPGSIGYTELTYALQNKMSFAAVKNASWDGVMKEPEAFFTAAKDILFCRA